MTRTEPTLNIRTCGVCGISFQRPYHPAVPDGYCATCWHKSLLHMDAEDKLGDAFAEDRADVLGQNGNEGLHYAEDSDAESALSEAMSMPSKYHVRLKGAWCDVYDVLKAFGVTNPADAHAIKKLLMPGKRGHKDGITDRREAIKSLHRAIELEGGA